MTGLQLLPWSPLKHRLAPFRWIATRLRLSATDGPHSPEHALEVELPFLQVLLARFAAVPLLVGDASLTESEGRVVRARERGIGSEG